jgi:hypothetical protein
MPNQSCRVLTAGEACLRSGALPEESAPESVGQNEAHVTGEVGTLSILYEPHGGPSDAILGCQVPLRSYHRGRLIVPV